MNGIKLIREVMKERGHSNSSLARALGYDTPSYVSEKLRRKKGMSLEWFVKMAEVMNCEIVVRSKLKDKNEWVLNNDSGEED